jgi:hypothetical protein
VASIRGVVSTVRDVADAYRDELAPAVARVWDDEVRVLERDLLRWLDYISPDPNGWEPWRFEFAFGLPDDRERDPRSVNQPALVGGRFLLRGSILSTAPADRQAARHRSQDRGRTVHARPGHNGGTVLQPVLTTPKRSRTCSISRCNPAACSSPPPAATRPRDTHRRSHTRAGHGGAKRLSIAPSSWAGVAPAEDVHLVLRCGPSEFRHAPPWHSALLEDLRN